MEDGRLSPMDPRESYAFFYRFPIDVTDSLWLRSGIRQEYSLVSDAAVNFVDIANIHHKFVDYKGHRIITCNWIGFNRLLLL